MMKQPRTCAVPPGNGSDRIGAMCARLPRLTAVALVVSTLLASCGSSERTGTAFCRQLGKEIPGIGLPITTKTEASAMVSRYERLLELAPLSIEKDLKALTDVLRQAEKLDAKDPVAVQKLADATYKSNQAALNVKDWVISTCAVDITTGQTVAPPRTVPPTTTTVPAATTTIAP